MLLLCSVAGYSTKYTLVTSTNELKSGDLVVIACNSVGCVAGELTGTNMPKVTEDVSFSSDKSSVTTSTAYEYAIIGGSSSWVLYYEDSPIGCTSNKNALTTDVSANKYSNNWELTIASSGDITYLCKSNSYKNTYLYYNSSAGFFANYDSKQKAVQFYKKASATDDTPAINCSGSVDFGQINLDNGTCKAEKKLNIEGANLTSNISLSITSGAENFSISTTELSATGGDVTVGFTAAKTGTFEGTLLAQSGSVSVNVTLKASAVEVISGGTKDQPYTCGDIVSMAKNDADTKAWVAGYILGSAATGPVVAKTANGTSLLLADDMNCTHPIAVQLPSGKVREKLNIVDNPNNIGLRVKVYGSLMTYFNSPGVKNTSDYVFIDEVVEQPVKVTDVSLNETSLELEIGESTTLVATVAPADAKDKSVTWSSSKEDVATVNASGKVEAVGEGNATITVTTTDGGFTATCEVTVKKPAPTEHAPAPQFSVPEGEVERGTVVKVTGSESDVIYARENDGEWQSATSVYH